MKIVKIDIVEGGLFTLGYRCPSPTHYSYVKRKQCILVLSIQFLSLLI